MTWSPRLLARMALLLAVTAVSAQISVPLPGGVPFTLQVLAVLLAGLLLPPGAAFATVAAYVLAGVLGLPVFAQGSAGLGVIAGPTGGYLLGFPFGALVAAAVARPGGSRASLVRLAAAALVGLLPIYALGVAWLSRFTGGVEQAVAVGVLPFIALDAVKAVIAAAAATRLPAVYVSERSAAG